MDHFSYLIDRQHRFLLIGVFLLAVAAASILTGQGIEPRRRTVYRAEEPRQFWFIVTVFCLAGLFFIGLFLYQRSK